MASIWDLFVTLGIDTKNFTAGLDAAEGKAKTAGGSITSNLSRVGGAIVVGSLAAAGAAVTALGGLMASSIGPASDLNETVSKASVVFGGADAYVLKFGKSAASSLGMSENAAIGAAATYGNLFRSMGMGTTTSAEMSVELVKLAGDLASFNNLDPTEVLDKLRAGLTGETEPLKTLGVNLSAAAVEAQAMKMGLVGAGKEMSASAKAQATYALIMQQTSLAQGDFARTSGGLANQQRILGATFENVKSTIGTALLPVVTQIATQMNTWLSDPAVVGGLTALATGVATFAGNVISYVPQVITWLQAVGTWLGENQGVIVGVFAALGVAVAAWAVTTITALAPVALAWITAMAPVIAIMAAVGIAAYLLYTAWTQNWGGIQQTVATAVAWIQTTVGIFLTTLQAWWDANGAQIIASVTAAWNTIVATVQAVAGAIGAFISSFLASVQAWWAENGATIMAGVQSAWDGIQAIIATVTSVISSVFAAFKSAFEGDWRGFGENLRVAWDTIWAAISTAVSNIWPVIQSKVSEGVNAIKNFFTTTDWGAVGKSIIEGIGNGISSMIGWLGDAARNAARAALDAAKGFLGIKSPSKVMMGVGKNMMLGMAVGIEQASPIPEQASRQAAASTASAAGAAGATNNYHFNYAGNASGQDILQSYEMARLMA